MDRKEEGLSHCHSLSFHHCHCHWILVDDLFNIFHAGCFYVEYTLSRQFILSPLHQILL